MARGARRCCSLAALYRAAALLALLALPAWVAVRALPRLGLAPLLPAHRAATLRPHAAAAAAAAAAAPRQADPTPPLPAAPPPWHAQLTLLASAQRHPPCALRRLLEGASAEYPGAALLVLRDADAPPLPLAPRLRLTRLQAAPEEGAADALNRLVAQLATPYALLLGDDLELPAAPALEALLPALAARTLDIAGVCLSANSSSSSSSAWSYSLTEAEGVLTQTAHLPCSAAATAGLPPPALAAPPAACWRTDAAPRPLLARADALRSVPWDAQLPEGLHEDFFLRAREAGARVGVCRGAAAAAQGGSACACAAASPAAGAPPRGGSPWAPLFAKRQLHGIVTAAGERHQLDCACRLARRTASALAAPEEEARALLGEEEPLARAALAAALAEDPAHHDALLLLTDLADVLWALGRAGEAEALYRQAAAWCAAHLASSHPDAVTAALNLADALQAQGRVREAGVLHAGAAAACSAGRGEGLLAACAGVALAGGEQEQQPQGAAGAGGGHGRRSRRGGAGAAADAGAAAADAPEPCSCTVVVSLERPLGPLAALAAGALGQLGALPDLTGAFAVLAQFKNEATGLREWLRHHLWQGVDHFLLLDNGSTDAWAPIAAEFGAAVTVLPAPARHAQVENYRALGLPWLAARRAEYVAILDLDEYWWSTAPNATFRELSVRALAGGDQLSCGFHHFGSSGWVRQPRSIRKCFTRRSAALSEVQFGKSVVRLSQLRAPSLHAHSVAGPTVPCPDGLALFHYKTQSRQYWESVKMARGSATTREWDAVRDWAFFAADDATGNATDDFRLRDALGMGEGDC